jgi:UDP-N-acetylmuramate dehydrogenase
LLSADANIAPQAHVPLAPLSTLGVGGAARWFVRASRPEDVAAAAAWARTRAVELFVLGGGSNVVIADRGIDALVLQVALPGISFREHAGETWLTAGAGESWDAVVAEAVGRGLAGIECLSGIPGTVVAHQSRTSAPMARRSRARSTR